MISSAQTLQHAIQGISVTMIIYTWAFARGALQDLEVLAKLNSLSMKRASKNVKALVRMLIMMRRRKEQVTLFTYIIY